MVAVARRCAGRPSGAGLVAEQRRQVGAADDVVGVVPDAELVDGRAVGEDAQVHHGEDRLVGVDPAAGQVRVAERGRSLERRPAGVFGRVLADGRRIAASGSLRQVGDGRQRRLLARRGWSGRPRSGSGVVALDGRLELAQPHPTGQRQPRRRIAVGVRGRHAVDELAALLGAVRRPPRRRPAAPTPSLAGAAAGEAAAVQAANRAAPERGQREPSRHCESPRASNAATASEALRRNQRGEPVSASMPARSSMSLHPGHGCW